MSKAVGERHVYGVWAARRTPNPVAGGQLLTTQQVMKLLGVCRTTPYHLVRAGELTPIRFGRYVRFLSSDVAAFIESHRT